ncbi:MAG: transcription elongation factor GreA [Blastocatellia bacterium]|nr:transcription elongation factor GreA [Blastocatellia bacterium]MCS7157123.1 transcription elongation factor GreA [Blastocatellia bacterium]MCX7752414.1 transcription elongation factor GreA [Blastocatellia bacterium]MDW8167297.1 transcription elongation factor GreA [Acidobacteriota bacterium]
MDVLTKLKERLEAELRALENELKFELPKELQRALAHGDLRENAEYQAALQRQEFVRARIAQIRKQLSDLSMLNVSALPRDRVAYGSTVTLLDLDTGEEVTYRLALGDEVDPERGVISVSSPIGSSLLGKREGDEVIVHTPARKRRFEIIKLITLPQELEGGEAS